jgi:uncharacterized membrane protein
MVQDETQYYKTDSLFIALLTNGDASVDYNLVIKSNKSNTNVTLFGQTAQNLTLTDYNESDIRYIPTGIPNKITVFSQTSPDIHVTYTTPDLVDKQNRNWTFSFFFPDKFLLKMPSQAHIIRMDPPPFLTPTDEQNLWGFGPGNVQVSYVVGPLGTREEAQASIRSVEEDIKNTKLNYDGIVLTNSTILLDKSKSAFKQENYLEAVTYSTNALILLQNTSQNYVLGQNAISQAESELQKKKNSGYDTSEAEGILSTAKNLFLTGEYKKSENGAKHATSQIGLSYNTFTPTVNMAVIVMVLLVVAILVMFFILRKRKRLAVITAMKRDSKDEQTLNGYQDSVSSHAHIDTKEGEDTSHPNNSKTKIQNQSFFPLNLPADSPRDGVEIKDYLKKVVQEVNYAKKNRVPYDKSAVRSSTAANQSIDKAFLTQLINQVKTEKPYLRSDDKDLLEFLCEKEGVAFESEIRNKFVLPRTSLWRLVKRLEREGLVEVKKIGGQNLIKLRFGDKSI